MEAADERPLPHLQPRGDREPWRRLALGHRAETRPQMVTVVDWTTLEAARLPLDLWQRMRPRPASGYSARRVRAAIKARLRYVRKTKTISTAAALLK